MYCCGCCAHTASLCVLSNLTAHSGIRLHTSRPSMTAYLHTTLCIATILMCARLGVAQPDAETLQGAGIFPCLNPTGVLSPVYAPSQSIDAHVWTNYSDGFVFPEISNTPYGIPALMSKPNWGLAVSGGGFRASSLANGIVRALWQMGYLQRMRYVSSNSGGSWFSSAFSYQNSTPIDTFLGPYLDPTNITLPAIQNLPAGSFQLASSTTHIGDVCTYSLDGKTFDNTLGRWAQVVSDAMLAPFGVDAANSTVSAAGTIGGIDAIYTRSSPVPVYIAGTNSRPFPIIQGSIRLPSDPAGLLDYPFEFTPLYFGSPGQHDTQPVALGGGYIEPLGFNSPPPARGVVSPDGSQTVNVKPTFIVPLMGAVGVSSSAQALKFGADTSTNTLMDLGQIEFDYVNLIDFEGAQLRFADGAGSDNDGIIGLLRRGVSTIVASSATFTAPTGTATDWATAQPDIAGLFGATPASLPSSKIAGGVSAQFWNTAQQVFPTAQFQTLFAKLQTAVNAGAAPVINITLPVLANSHQGVKGGFNATLVWYINAQTTQWEQQLPSATLAYLNNARNMPNGGLNNYPYTNNAASYSTPQPEWIGLLNQQASWSMMQVKDMLEAALQRAKAA